MTSRRLIYGQIREELLKAAIREGKKREFSLSGRGCEARVTLDRCLAAVLRNCNLPRTQISGFGANNYYPERVFRAANSSLYKRLGWKPFCFGKRGNIYIVDVPATEGSAVAK